MKHPIDLKVAANLKAIRKASGFRQCDLAMMIGLTTNQITKYERGTDRITCGRLSDIAKVFGKPVEWFFNDPV